MIEKNMKGKMVRKVRNTSLNRGRKKIPARAQLNGGVVQALEH
jgi:hypothetical protein